MIKLSTLSKVSLNRAEVRLLSAGTKKMLAKATAKHRDLGAADPINLGLVRTRGAGLKRMTSHNWSDSRLAKDSLHGNAYESAVNSLRNTRSASRGGKNANGPNRSRNWGDELADKGKGEGASGGYW